MLGPIHTSTLKKMATGSFSYSSEEGENIIVPDTLFKQIDAETSDAKKNTFRSKEAFRKRFQIADAYDYVVRLLERKKKIPRGLRIKKFPSFGFGDTEFKNKWEAILNKCSLDLMLLLIEEAKKQKCTIDKEIISLKQEISIKYKDHELPFEK